jgi:poly-beta-1,6-N-acetyl-D-glucosamine biosynthesis protein PgaD
MVDRMTDTTIGFRDTLDRRLKARDTLLTTVLWAIYAYLWLPFISLLAWFIGIDFAYGLVEQAGGLGNLLHLLISFSAALISITIIVIGWSAVQYWRFHDSERRTGSPSPSYDDELSLWNIDAETLFQIRRGHRLTIDLDELGAIKSVADPDLSSAPTPSPPRVVPSPSE